MAAQTNTSISPICPNVPIERMTNDELNFSLSRFVHESQKQNGDPYPGKTLRELVVCIQMYLEKKGKVLKFLTDPQFAELQNTLDSTMKARAKQGKVKPSHDLLNCYVLDRNKPMYCDFSTIAGIAMKTHLFFVITITRFAKISFVLYVTI